MENNPRVQRSKCEVLPLTLKKKWYDMIDSLDKFEEYRTSNRVKRMIEQWYGRSLMTKKNLVVEFFHGYSRGRRKMAFYADPPISRSVAMHPEWGEPEQEHYVIPLSGCRIELV